MRLARVACAKLIYFFPILYHDKHVNNYIIIMMGEQERESESVASIIFRSSIGRAIIYAQ